METSDPVDTPMVEKPKLDADPQGKEVDPTRYRGMIGSLMYLTDSCVVLTTFADADHAGCHDTKRSTSGSMQLLGDRLKIRCCAQILWMRSQLNDYGLGFNKIPMYCDNKNAIALCCKNVHYSRSKHIDIIYQFVKEQVENRVVELYCVKTEYQLVDIFTKALRRERLDFLINKLGMRSMSFKTLKNSGRLRGQGTVKEETFEVIIDVIKNSTCYKAFTISTKVPEIFMQQFWDTIKKVSGVDFAELPDDETTLTFLLYLGYKSPLHKHLNIYVDHMHQPWRTLAANINKCLF
nr:hypothetical protein [Tanacetum cinerariifolium]